MSFLYFIHLGENMQTWVFSKIDGLLGTHGTYTNGATTAILSRMMTNTEFHQKSGHFLVFSKSPFFMDDWDWKCCYSNKLFLIWQSDKKIIFIKIKMIFGLKKNLNSENTHLLTTQYQNVQLHLQNLLIRLSIVNWWVCFQKMGVHTNLLRHYDFLQL